MTTYNIKLFAEEMESLNKGKRICIITDETKNVKVFLTTGGKRKCRN